jgi:hypothetical protein
MADRAPEPRYTDDPLERVLVAWRDWRTGAAPNPLGYARAGVDPASTTTVPASHVPTLLGLAMEIDGEVRRLAPPLRTVLRLEYLRPDLTLDAKAAALGLGSRRSYCRRLDAAKRVLARRIAAKRRRATERYLRSLADTEAA